MDWGFSWAVVVTGLVVVFVVLILLVLLCMGLGKVFATLDKKNNEKKTNDASTPAAAPVKPQGGAAVIEMTNGSVAEEVVAAITAAISAMMSEDGVTKPFTVKSIKRTKDARPVWNVAGIQDNTRPF